MGGHDTGANWGDARDGRCWTTEERQDHSEEMGMRPEMVRVREGQQIRRSVVPLRLFLGAGGGPGVWSAGDVGTDRRSRCHSNISEPAGED